MAETLAVAGVVASIAQLVEFGLKISRRLDEFHASLGEVPRTFRHIKAELPVLLDALQKTKDKINAASTRDETRQALITAIEGCGQEIQSLDAVLRETLPVPGDSLRERSKKAFLSLRRE